jgi:hypothetical protein
MKHWKAEQSQEMQSPGINLIDEDLNRTVSITLAECGLIDIREGCDGFFYKRCTKAEAIAALQEAIAWIAALPKQEQP